jgi:hypothetical protein
MAFVAAALPAAALASPTVKQQTYEACLMRAALALEPTGAQVGEILAAAERVCRGTKGELANASVDEVAGKVRLAVMQQRSNALHTGRRM